MNEGRPRLDRKMYEAQLARGAQSVTPDSVRGKMIIGLFQNLSHTTKGHAEGKVVSAWYGMMKPGTPGELPQAIQQETLRILDGSMPEASRQIRQDLENKSKGEKP